MGNGVSVDERSLREVLAVTKEFSPALTRALRKELRSVGDDVIAEQRAILRGPLPPGVMVQKQTLRLGKGKKSGKWGVRVKNHYGDRDVQRPGRTSGMREEIAAGLKTRVIAGKTREGITVQTSGKSTMRQAWEKDRFRHPVFGNKSKWVDQRGGPYFYAPALAGSEQMREQAIGAIDRAMREVVGN